MTKLADLSAKYPTAYGITAGVREPFDERGGFECHDGWYAILDTLGAVLEAHGVHACQVKEKFGTLRVYVNEAPDEVHAAIKAAELDSIGTCEDCGGPGVMRTAGGWLRTRCDRCHDLWGWPA